MEDVKNDLGWFCASLVSDDAAFLDAGAVDGAWGCAASVKTEGCSGVATAEAVLAGSEDASAAAAAAALASAKS